MSLFIHNHKLNAALLVAGLSLVSTATHAAWCEAASSSSKSPYDNTSGYTKSVLSVAKHQYQGQGGKFDCLSKSEMTDGDHADKAVGGSDYFYYHNEAGIGDTLYFKINENVIARTELRMDSWRADTINPRPKLYGTFNIRGSSSARSHDFTVGQLHIDTNKNLTTDSSAITSSPMLRIAYLKSRDGISNHLWAIFRPDPNANGSGAYQYEVLGPALTGSSSPNTYTMDYGTNSGTTIKVVGNGVTHRFDISKWKQSDIYVYHKAGCYTDGDIGDCQIQFTELRKVNY